MHIGIVGPIATENIISFLDDKNQELPVGYMGAPILGTLIGELICRGHTVSAFTTSRGISISTGQWVSAKGERFSIYYCGLRPHSFRPKYGRLGRAMDMFAMERTCLCQAIQAAAPEIIHAHWSYEFGLAAIESGLPHVITCHDAPHKVLRYIPNLYRLVRYWMGRRCLAHAKVVTAVSPYLQKEVQRYVHVPVAVVPNPLPPSDATTIIAAIRRKNSDLRHPIVCMAVNGWGRRKNVQPALYAFQLLRQNFPAAKLCLYGADFGPDEIAEKWSRSHGLKKGVRFIGRLPYSSLLAEISKSDILLHTSLEETFGMSIAEAMSLGIPVVGGRNSGAVPWVIGEGGMVTDVKSPGAIAETLSEILGNKQTYLRCVRAAQKHIHNLCNVRTVTQLYERQYQIALDQVIDSWKQK